MLTNVGGTFVKIAFATEAHLLLARGCPERPPARFNRLGQDALYLSPDEASARVAMGQYIKAGDPPRVLITYHLEPCALFDLRHPGSAPVYTLAGKPWLSVLAAGGTPPAWLAADNLRASGHAGLIDPSRRQPGLWHITLFRWNEPGAPRVTQISEPRPIEIAPA